MGKVVITDNLSHTIVLRLIELMFLGHMVNTENFC